MKETTFTSAFHIGCSFSQGGAIDIEKGGFLLIFGRNSALGFPESQARVKSRLKKSCLPQEQFCLSNEDSIKTNSTHHEMFQTAASFSGFVSILVSCESAWANIFMDRP